MRESRFAGIANLSNLLTTPYRLLTSNTHASAPEMAVLGFPSAFVDDNDTIPAFAAFDGLPITFRDDKSVRVSVSKGFHDSIRRGQYGNAACGVSQSTQTDVGPFVTVIRDAPTCIVLGPRTRINIDVLLNKASLAQLALCRQAKFWRRSGCGTRERQM